MKKFLLCNAIIISAMLSMAQCEDGRYHDLIFLESEVESDILYGNNVDLYGISTDLYLDVYTPEGDTETQRPLVLFAHGGSFVAGSKTGNDVVPLCEDFARMGYTTASIQYRLGLPFTTDLELPATEAVVRGYHDMKAAIRFFRKSVAEDENPYGINPDQIYLAGVSAGGFVTLHVAYMDEMEEFPSILDLTVDGLTGGLEGDSGNPGYSSEVNAIVNICGAVGDTTWIHLGDEPLLSFHGPWDTTVPYGSETLTIATIPVLEVDGSESIHEKAEQIGLKNCFEIYEDAGHVPHSNNQQYYDTTRAIMSNFLSHLVCPDIDLDCTYTELLDLNVKDEVSENQIHLYPNPAGSLVNIQVPVSLGTAEVTIYNSLGKEVLTQKINRQTTEISTRNLITGVYTLVLQNRDFRNVSKLVIKK